VRTNKSALLCHYDRALNCGSQGLFSAICERRRDTRISRREASPCVESISCRHFASQTVEDELETSRESDRAHASVFCEARRAPGARRRAFVGIGAAHLPGAKWPFWRVTFRERTWLTSRERRRI